MSRYEQSIQQHGALGRLAADHGRRADRQSGGIWIFLADGVHVLFDAFARGVVPGDDPSSDGCGLVGGHTPFLRAYRVTALSVAGHSVRADYSIGVQNLSVGDARTCR